ncbi:FAD-dependent monooxygenase [Nonomuraea sp. NPDC005650]|uniref:FAD-dependent monooxygenase n=1 Tax=Nonomuraea sp. NPDC005650 TaxID=3157045 RepID=UPI0033A288E5
MPEFDTDVLVVGGGGAGLTASMLLSRLGVAHLLVSALPATSALPKAHLLNQRTMEIFAELGIAETVYRRGTPPEQMRYSGWYAGLAGPAGDYGRRFGLIESWGCGGLSADWAVASPQRQTNLPQIRLEPILKSRAEELAPGRVCFHHEVTAFTQDADGVTATVLDRGAGRPYQVRARYLLACDGGRTVGRQLGIAMEGARDLARIATVHLSADLSAWARDPEVLIRWLSLPHTGGAATMVPMGPDRWGPDSEEWVVHLNYATDDPRGLDDEQVIADLRAALGLPDHPLTVHLITRWSIEGVVADRFRDGRVFLLGDAAHRHPPTGGLGLNSAIQDAANLAWKLAAVLYGHAAERLLDTYEPERKPVTARNVRRSVDNALNHIVTAQAAGIVPGAGPEANWRQLRRLWSGLPEDAGPARAVRRAIAAQSMEFNEHNVEYGYTYSSAAVLPDGTSEPGNPDPVRLYQPCARPGHPLPHAWLDDDHGRRLPVHDLLRPGRFLLVAGENGQDWCEAAAELATAWPLDAVRVGHLDGDLLDPRSTWTRHRGHGPEGAVLVRPDRFVAWRAQEATDATARLSQALRSLLGH